MLIPSRLPDGPGNLTSLSRRVNANSQRMLSIARNIDKLIKKGEC